MDITITDNDEVFIEGKRIDKNDIPNIYFEEDGCILSLRTYIINHHIEKFMKKTRKSDKDDRDKPICDLFNKMEKCGEIMIDGKNKKSQ